MLARSVDGCRERGLLGCDGGDDDDNAVAELLALEGVDCELGCADGMGDVDFDRFVGVGGDIVYACVEVPETGP